MTIYGIVGNREGWTYDDLDSILDDYIYEGKEVRIQRPDIILVSGGAKGIDTFVKIYALRHNIPIKVFLPDLSKPSPERYFERNRKIVDASDYIIACNDKVISGTMNTIHYALKVGKPIDIYKHVGRNVMVLPESYILRGKK